MIRVRVFNILPNIFQRTNSSEVLIWAEILNNEAAPRSLPGWVRTTVSKGPTREIIRRINYPMEQALSNSLLSIRWEYHFKQEEKPTLEYLRLCGYRQRLMQRQSSRHDARLNPRVSPQERPPSRNISIRTCSHGCTKAYKPTRPSSLSGPILGCIHVIYSK